MFKRFLNSMEETIIILLLATMTLLVFFEVVLRFSFNIGFMWSEELTLLLSGWLVLFGASYGVKVGSHIGVDALVRILPPKLRRIVSGAAVCACIGYTVLFALGSWDYLSKMRMIGIELDDLPLPKWIAHSILLIGMVLIAVRLLQLLWAVFTGKADGFNLTDEAKESMHLAEETTQAANKGGDSA
jgi:C4-dicarboxylate transporter DctQ subunit